MGVGITREEWEEEQQEREALEAEVERLRKADPSDLVAKGWAVKVYGLGGNCGACGIG